MLNNMLGSFIGGDVNELLEEGQRVLSGEEDPGEAIQGFLGKVLGQDSEGDEGTDGSDEESTDEESGDEYSDSDYSDEEAEE